jgi:drug/metabolite transporter (DMT)-like permease
MYLLVSLGLSLIAHVCIIRAYALTPAGVLQPLNYVGLAASVLIGVAFLNEHPDGLVYAGIAAIVAAGLYIAWHETRGGH